MFGLASQQRRVKASRVDDTENHRLWREASDMMAESNRKFLIPPACRVLKSGNSKLINILKLPDETNPI